MLHRLKQSNSEMPKLGAGGSMPTCSDLHTGTDRWVICFERSHGLLDSVFMKGYGVEFKDYKKLGDKHVARTIENDPEPGTHLQAKITELAELTRPDEQVFAASESTPSEKRLETVRIDQDVVRKLALGSTEIDWPTVGEGLTTGVRAVYISADRSGQVREVWPEGCDNPGLQDPLRDQVKKWKFKRIPLYSSYLFFKNKFIPCCDDERCESVENLRKPLRRQLVVPEVFCACSCLQWRTHPNQFSPHLHFSFRSG
jgi:hypothetical protein